MRAALVAMCTACGACGGAPAAPVAHPPMFDRAIVLGDRVGPIALGMTEADMFAAVGRATPTPYGGSRLGYMYPKLKIHVAVQAGRVVFVAPDDPAYATASGVHIGSSEQELLAGAGAEPTWRRQNHGNVDYCFAHTLVTISGGGDDPICPGGHVCDIAVGGC